MRIGIVTRNRSSWNSTQLRKSLSKHEIAHASFGFQQLRACVAFDPPVKVGKFSVARDFNALIIRPVGRGSVDELVFRLDVLYRLERMNLYVLNSPEAIERCVDKYDVLTVLEENSLPVPRTAVTENVAEALRAFAILGGDVIVKPLHGSRGIGSTRVRDPEIASTIFRAIVFNRGVIYIQEFIPHGFSDIRAFVIGDRVVASMRRVAQDWKTNYSQGGKPVHIKLDKQLEELAVKSAMVVGCKIAGVDIIEQTDRPLVVEVNSLPGWKGLQSVAKVNIADEIIDFVLSELKR